MHNMRALYCVATLAILRSAVAVATVTPVSFPNQLVEEERWRVGLNAFDVQYRADIETLRDETDHWKCNAYVDASLRRVITRQTGNLKPMPLPGQVFNHDRIILNSNNKCNDQWNAAIYPTAKLLMSPTPWRQYIDSDLRYLHERYRYDVVRKPKPQRK